MSSDDRFNPYTPPKARSTSDADTGVLPPRPAPRPKAKWKTVASFGSDARALEAVRLLENAHIECRVIQDAPPSDTHILAMKSVPLGGHLVQVAPEDLVDAAKVLGVDVDETETADEVVNVPDERMKQALLWAGFGIFLCPGPAHVASMVLVLATTDFVLTPTGRRHRRWAAAIDLVMFAIVAFVIATNK